MISFVKSLAVELASRDVTVNAVAPGWADTEMVAQALDNEGRDRIAAAIPVGRVASARDIAGPIVFPAHSRLTLAVLGFVMVLLGILGDLFESRLKREANVKDSSSLFPWHGGVLDRIDALLFVTPAFVIAAGVVK
jgi:hypothetical protein